MARTGRTIKPTFSITTLGCKLNQYESECIRQNLIQREWEFIPFGDEADFYIINTCTVTGKTDSRCRNAIRRARKISPDSTIVVTGCYAETQADRLEEMRETDLVIGNKGKQTIPDILDCMVGRADRKGSQQEGDNFQIDKFSGHARAFIKIQEGCDATCTYCIIPRARGRSRSVPVTSVLNQIKKLEKNGIEEIVLTGIHIGRYGRDLDEWCSLDCLLERILENTDRIRIRLSSIEVNEVTEGIMRMIAETQRLAPHLHIPLQNGDDNILKAMNRPYNTAFFRSRIEAIRDLSDNVGIGTDIITGFPGEGQENFDRTFQFLKSLPFTYFHVFSFSKRPGTPAEKMKGQVDSETRKHRTRNLIELGKIKKKSFMRSRTGTRELALVQGKTSRCSRFYTAITGNYCEIMLDCNESLVGKLVPVDISHYSRGRIYGRVVEGASSTSRSRIQK